MDTSSKNYKYFFALSFGLFWSVWVLLGQLSKVLKNGLSYFRFAKQIEYPSCVLDSKYGKSCFKEVKTTKGNAEPTTLRLHYVISGEGNKDTMLFLHGFPEFWFSWRYQITEFSDTYQVIAMDMRGYGLSEKPSKVADYQTTHLVNDVKALLDSLGIRNVVLVAHDWGGIVGWNFEHSYPEMVKKYITLNIPHPIAFRNTMQKSFKQFLKSWYINFFQVPFLPEWILSRLDYTFIKEAFTSKHMGLRKTKLSDEETLAFQANMSRKGALKAGIDYYRAILQYKPTGLQLPSCDEDNRYMLIFGENDGAIEVKTATETISLIPKLALKLLPGLSHWVQQDDPVVVNKLIRDFLSNAD